MAGITLDDVDVVELYDAFTINTILFLEDMGFCPKGEGGRFVEGGRIAPGGSLPVNTNGGGLSCVHPGMYGMFLTIEAVEDMFVQILMGTSFLDLRREAAHELCKTYYPEEYGIWEHSLCDGLIFDEDRVLNSPCWSVEELTFGNQKVLLIAPQ